MTTHRRAVMDIALLVSRSGKSADLNQPRLCLSATVSPVAEAVGRAVPVPRVILSTKTFSPYLQSADIS
jgi:hypothetical protein